MSNSQESTKSPEERARAILEGLRHDCIGLLRVSSDVSSWLDPHYQVCPSWRRPLTNYGAKGMFEELGKARRNCQDHLEIAYDCVHLFIQLVIRFLDRTAPIAESFSPVSSVQPATFFTLETLAQMLWERVQYIYREFLMKDTNVTRSNRSISEGSQTTNSSTNLCESCRIARTTVLLIFDSLDNIYSNFKDTGAIKAFKNQVSKKYFHQSNWSAMKDVCEAICSDINTLYEISKRLKGELIKQKNITNKKQYEFDKEIYQLNSTATSLREQLKMEQKQSSEYLIECQKSENKCNEIVKEKESLESELKMKDERIKKLLADTEEINNDLKSLKRVIDDKNEQLNSKQSEMKLVQAHYEKELRALNERLNQAVKDSSFSLKSINHQRNEINNLHEQIKTMQKSSKQKIDELESSLKTEKQHRLKAEKLLEKYSDDISDHASKINEKDKKIEELERQIKSLDKYIEHVKVVSPFMQLELPVNIDCPRTWTPKEVEQIKKQYQENKEILSKLSQVTYRLRDALKVWVPKEEF